MTLLHLTTFLSFMKKNRFFLLVSFVIICFLLYFVQTLVKDPFIFSKEKVASFFIQQSCLNILLKICYLFTLYSLLAPFSFWFYLYWFKVKIELTDMFLDLLLFLLWFILSFVVLSILISFDMVFGILNTLITSDTYLASGGEYNLFYLLKTSILNDISVQSTTNTCESCESCGPNIKATSPIVSTPPDGEDTGSKEKVSTDEKKPEVSEKLPDWPEGNDRYQPQDIIYRDTVENKTVRCHDIVQHLEAAAQAAKESLRKEDSDGGVITQVKEVLIDSGISATKSFLGDSLIICPGVPKEYLPEKNSSGGGK